MQLLEGIRVALESQGQGEEGGWVAAEAEREWGRPGSPFRPFSHPGGTRGQIQDGTSLRSQCLCPSGPPSCAAAEEKLGLDVI